MKAIQFVLLMAIAGVAGTVNAQTLPCSELRNIVDAAETDFASLRGERVRTETPADIARGYGAPEPDPDGMKYLNEVYTTTQPLSGGDCEIRSARIDDDAASMNQTVFFCSWQQDAPFETLKGSLTSCFANAEVDEDAGSIDLYVDYVSSGEGYRGLSLSASESPLGEFQLSVVKTVCLNRAPGGCGDD